MRFFISLLLIFVLSFSSTVFAISPNQTISTVTRLDTPDNKVYGEDASYTLSLPYTWNSGYVVADREKVSPQAKYLEKVILTYIPKNKTSKPISFFSLYVYKGRYNAILSSNQRKILETNLYTFVVETETDNNFTDAADRDYFGYLLILVNNDIWTTNLIQVPKTQTKITSNTVNVNGKLLKKPSVLDANGVLFIPVREACQALDYMVSWAEVERDVVIARNAEVHILPTRENGKQNYQTLIVNNMAYVSSVFFMRALNASIEVDGYDNVVISQ